MRKTRPATQLASREAQDPQNQVSPPMRIRLGLHLKHSLIVLLSMQALVACGSSGSSTNAIEPNPAKEIGGCFGKNCGPTNESFFSNDNYGTLRLTFTEEDLKPYAATPDQWEDLLWSKWKSQCGNYDWIPVNMEYTSGDGAKKWTLNKVGMRMRGSKSRGYNPLAGFKLDYNEFIPKSLDREFADMKRFDLLSNEKDPSGMLQCLTYELMRDFGIPAPKCNHVQVIINDKVYGMMESIEGLKDKAYLRRHFANPEGPLFGVSASNVVCGYPLSQGDLEYKGDTFTGDYLKAYEVLRGTAADAEATLIPMLKCGDNVTTPNDEDFRACIKNWINVEDWLKLIAAESLAPTVEDFIGARRNFYLYFEPSEFAQSAGQMRIWGWDYDTALDRQLCYPAPATADAPTCADPFKTVTSWFGPRGQRQKLVVRLTNVFRAEYCKVMKEFLDTVYLPEKVTKMASVIQPAMADDPVMKANSWDWPAEVEKMHAFMIEHRAEMQTVVASLCAAPASTGTPDPMGTAGAPATGMAGAAGASTATTGTAGTASTAGGAGGASN